MKNYPPLPRLFLLVLTTLLPIAITQAYSLRQFSSKNGLSNSAILSICQDEHGFMWFGTCDGLNMFDGLNVHIYKPTNSANNLSGNLIENIIRTDQHTLWVQTNYGLDRFDQRNKTIQSFKEYKSRIHFAVSHQKDLFIISGNNSIGYYNRQTENIENIAIPNLPFGSILDITIDSNDVLWIFSKDKEIRKFRIEPEENRINLLPEPSAWNNEELRYCFHEDDKVFFVSKSDGLYEYDLATGKPYYIYDLHQEIMSNGEISSIIKHHSDYYIGFKTSGLIRLQATPEQKSPFHITEINIKSGIFCLVKDKFQDVIWVGTDGQGVFMYFVDAFSIQSTLFNGLLYPINNPVRSLFLDKEQTLWIGTKGDGILKVYDYTPGSDIQTNKTEHLLSSNSLLKNNQVYAFSESRKNLLWIGSEKGLNYYSYKDRKIKNIALSAEGTEVKYIHSICEFNDSTLWIATVGEGIVKAHLSGSADTPVITHAHRITIDKGRLSSNYFFTIYQESDSILWFGNRGYGALRMNVNTEKYVMYHLDEDNTNQTLNDIFSIVKTKDDYWFGTSFGLVLWRDGKKQVFNEANGFPNNTIHTILQDKQGNLWLSTNQGLVKFNTEQMTVQAYNQLNELEVIEFSDGAFYKDNLTGALMFGGINGFVTISENEYSQKDYLPPIQFTGLSIFGKDYNIYDFLTESRGKEILTLDYSKNFFTIAFAAIDYINGSNYTYLYKLDELSDTWFETGNVNFATFTNISPGNYTLSVKYRNNITGKDSPVYTLTIKILPPWYETSWAYLCYAILIAFLIIAIIRMSMKWYKMKRDAMFEKLNRQQKEEIYESKLRFFTNITHELCTPLTLIYGPCEKILSYTRTDLHIRKYATLIQHNAERLNALIQELIEFRRLETGNKTVDIREVDASELMQDIADSFAELAESRGISYQINIQQDIKWNSDAGCLSKVVTNLLSNAFKYTFDHGEVKVELFVEELVLNLVITNAGKGIEKEHISAIFDRYRILDDFEGGAKNGGFSRNGLGLAICHSMVKLLEGDIEVTSTLNEYTSFRVKLPLLPLPEHSETEKIFHIEKEVPQPGAGTDISFEHVLPIHDKSKSTIMIVDDDPAMLWFVSQILSEKYNVIPVNDPTEVMNLLKQAQPNLIISDIMMPDIDGISLTKTIKSNKLLKHIPLILLSAKNDVTEQVTGIESGAEAYITKPFNVEYLEKIVSRLIQRKEDLKEYYHSGISAFELEEGRYVHLDDKEFFEKMLQIVDENISNPDLSVDVLSKLMGCSTRRLYRKLKGFTEQTPNEIIRDYRLNLAERLLVNTQLSVDEILFKAGFANRGNFFRQFSQKFSMTPKSYRDQKKKEISE